ncbi:3-dehydroquinate synthase [Campylobacter majalis]|uniref:3-dehydroquinate synthase n=1 Tax=Campylobacter majalis TaxID=2790656 RepID=A0ABN7KB16_9BACT|nr:3-dehydroquinate synthase [Campylobacter majalis]CAD7289655.1 3-dehydroquinate synthase [Campylobacter majalis]
MQVDIKLKQNEKNYKVFINELDKISLSGKVAIITNAKIAGLHLNTLFSKIIADEVYVVTIPDGEEYKNLNTCEDILRQLFISKLDRTSTLIGFGGGVVTDMTGFVASIYERGIKFINIPTTLLAQVDASVGGKTGVNNSFGKNLIGTFYQPEAVYCQMDFLRTLPSREFNAGVAEVIKMAVMFDNDMFKWLQQADLKNESELSKLVQKSIQLKADVVSKDERERGLRAVLNYGHTFAHVIENQTQYKCYLHGEAVAIGMNMANSLALKLGLIDAKQRDMIKNLMHKFNLPTHYKIENVENFYNAFLLDKKSENDKIKFILPCAIGDNLIKSDVSKDDVLEILSEFK